MHEYDSRDINTCLSSRRIVFVGDSVTRQIFWAFAKKLDVQEQEGDKHSKISLDVHGLKVEFFWDPYLNTSDLAREVAAVSLPGSRKDQIDTTAILLIGGGLWNARYLAEASQQRYETSIGEIARALQDVSRTPSSQSGQNHEGRDDLAIIAPIHIPRYEALSPDRARTITPTRVKSIFQFLQQSSVRHNITVAWSFSHMTWREPSAYGLDGLHVTGAVAGEMVDVLLNARCNAVLRQSSTKGYPMDKTCCNKYPRPDWTQTVILIISLGLLPTFLVTFDGGSFFSIEQTAR